MSVKIPVATFKAVDPSATCRNWTLDADSEQRRMGDHAEAMQELARALNNLLAWQNRPVLSQAWPLSTVDTVGMSPFIVFRYPDKVRNARHYTTTFIAAAPQGDTNGVYAYAEQWNAAGPETPWLTVNVASLNAFYDLTTVAYSVERGVRTDAEYDDGINTFNKMTVVSVNQWDDFILKLDSSLHVFCDPTLAQKGGKVLADALADVRKKFHQVRSENLPIVLQWCAQGVTGTTAAPGDHTGITVSAIGDVNLFDQADTAWAAASVAAHIDLYRAGIGPEWTTDGRKIPVMCRVYGKVDTGDAETADVTFYGPSGIASNSTTIQVGEALQWYGDSNSIMYLDSAAASDDVGTTANRIGAYGHVNDANYPLHVYALRCWVHWDRGVE